MRKLVAGITLTSMLYLSGCSPRPPATGYADDIPGEIKALIAKNYNQSIYAVGTARGPDESIARNKAAMQARAEIARQFKSQIDVLQKDYEEEVNGRAIGEYNQVMESFSVIELSGSTIAKSMVRPEKSDLYSAKVLVVVTAEQLKTIIDEKMRAYTSYRATKAYKELEKRVEKERKRNSDGH